MGDPDERVRALLDEHIEVIARTRDELIGDVIALAEDLAVAIERGGKLVVFGNGGSAADAQHFAAELVGRFSRPRGPLPALALTTDSSALTAIANDFDYSEVFARQVRALAREGDLILAISTSGQAENVVRGARAARELGARTWGLTGGSGGRVATAVDRCLRIPASATARVQEAHVTVIHAVSELLDERFAERGGRPGSPASTEEGTRPV